MDLGCRHLPEPVREDLLETDPARAWSRWATPIVGVIGDTVAGADPDPWRLSTLHFYLDRHCLVSTRRAPDQLRLQARPRGPRRPRGAQLGRARGLAALHAAESLNERAVELASRDRPDRGRGAGRAHRRSPRQRLGKARRRAAKLRRQVALRPRAHRPAARRLPTWIDENDRFELLDALDRMETLVDELQAIEQREAGLEAEVAARLSEETNRNLLHPVVVTVIFLPMTLITGIFGMNVAGLPGLDGPERVLVGDAGDGVVPAAFLLAIRWRGRS